jgi:NitT/TauT family transport system ATP-binding protein
VLFLDEPFSALDYEMVMFLRERLQKVLVGRKVTTLLVSHDLDEAVLLADHVLLLTKRPTQVADNLPFDVPRPRTAATTVSPEFIDVKTRALEIFQREVRK